MRLFNNRFGFFKEGQRIADTPIFIVNLTSYTMPPDVIQQAEL
jgi:hypothetical protein